MIFPIAPSITLLLELADFVKVDLLDDGERPLGGLVSVLRRFRARLVAEKVETAEQFRGASSSVSTISRDIISAVRRRLPTAYRRPTSWSCSICWRAWPIRHSRSASWSRRCPRTCRCRTSCCAT
ncbi:MAG: EAL domain-containing protein [Chromatiales bacterium]|nr:EAL domain-containing protein [Chromatiales bacterium]